MTASNGYIQESKVQFVVDAVYSFAYALHHAWSDLCLPHQGYCPRLKELDGENFYKQYLLNVSFIGEWGLFYSLLGVFIIIISIQSIF